MVPGAGLWPAYFICAWVARATGPAEALRRLLAKALRHDYGPSLSAPVGESPTGTGGSPVPPNQSGAVKAGGQS